MLHIYPYSRPVTTQWSTIWTVNARQGQPQREGILDTNLTHDTWAIHKDDCLSTPFLTPPHTFALTLTKHVHWHETTLRHIRTTSYMFLSESLLFSYLWWRCCDEFKCSSINSGTHTPLISVISDFHVPVTICLSAPGCYVSCTSMIMNNSFNSVSFRYSKDVLRWWMVMLVAKVILKVGKPFSFKEN